MLENSFAAAAVVTEAIDEESQENCYSYHDYEFWG